MFLLFAKSKSCKNIYINKYNQVNQISWFGTKREKLSVSGLNAAVAYISVTTAFNSRKKKAVIVTAVFSFPAAHIRVKAVLDESFTEQVD